jgi:TolB protein
MDRDLLTRTYRTTILSYTVHFCPGSHNVSKRMDQINRQTPHSAATGARLKSVLSVVVLLLLLAFSAFPSAFAQDWVRTGSGLGVEKVRLAVPDFKAAGDVQSGTLLKTFNDTFWSDLDNSGVVELISKSFYPLQVPGQPAEVTFGLWSSPPPNAAMLAFGNLGVTSGKVTVQGWLYDVKNTATPQVLGKQYSDVASDDAARTIAHKFADEIIFRLGGGIPGIAESKIYFVSDRSGHKEIWVMDYDGANQHQLTHLGSTSLSPRISPDGSRLALSSLTKSGWEILMFSIDLNRTVSFPHFGGTNLSPAWSPDGTRLALSSSRGGHSEIYVCDASGANLHAMTTGRGLDVSPTWNRKTGAQIAFVDDSTRLPQIYTMEADGTNQQRMTDQGYAVDPNWSPNGQFLAMAWKRNYGPGEPGSRDIYLMDVASKQWVQLTHEGGAHDSPSWAPDGRHIVFQSNRSGKDELWMMLADGTKLHQLTIAGRNSQPNWSWK